MNRGVWRKTVAEVWLGTLLFALAVFLFEAVIAAVLPNFYSEMETLLGELPFMRFALRGLLGSDLGARVGPTALASVAWIHPVVLALLWAHEITLLTRVPAGEIDRGTIDVLLGWPVSRRAIYLTETAAWLVSGALVLGAAFLGNALGSWTAPAELVIPLPARFSILVNLLCLYLAVGGIACLVSAASERRGRAVAGVFAIVVASFFLHVLAQFWPKAESFAWLGLLHYYRPVEIVGAAEWPVGDMAVLLGVALVAWVAGGLVFARRDMNAL